MNNLEIVEGEIYRDVRGRISSLNHFGLEDVHRVYFIQNSDVSIIRGWHGHKLERKWFYCVYGSFTIGLVEIDDFSNPSPKLSPTWLTLCDTQSRLVCIPAGWASWIKADVSDSVLMVMSDKKFDEALAKSDSYRFPADWWSDGKGL